MQDLVSPRNLGVATAIVVFIATFRGAVPSLFERPTVRRLLPVLPVLLGVAAAFGGFTETVGPASWQNRLVIGILTGAAAASLYKVGKTTVLGQGLVFETAPQPVAPAPAAKED